MNSVGPFFDNKFVFGNFVSSVPFCGERKICVCVYIMFGEWADEFGATGISVCVEEAVVSAWAKEQQRIVPTSGGWVCWLARSRIRASPLLNP